MVRLTSCSSHPRSGHGSNLRSISCRLLLHSLAILSLTALLLLLAFLLCAWIAVDCIPPAHGYVRPAVLAGSWYSFHVSVPSISLVSSINRSASSLLSGINIQCRSARSTIPVFVASRTLGSCGVPMYILKFSPPLSPLLESRRVPPAALVLMVGCNHPVRAHHCSI